MASTFTPYLNLEIPARGDYATTGWDTPMDGNLNKIDTAYGNVGVVAVPIGVISMFAGPAAPSNWLICNGASLSTTAYAGLFAVIGYTYGGSGANFNIPNLGAQFPIGVGTNPQGVGTGLGEVAGSFAVTLPAAALPVHNHGISDPSHAHNVYDPTHIHGVGDPTHSHSASQPAHSHSVANQNTSPFAGTTGVTTAGTGGGSTGSAQPGVTVNAAATGIYLGYAATGVAIYGAVTGITTQNAGSGAAFNVVPPFVAVNFIIKYR